MKDKFLFEEIIILTFRISAVLLMIAGVSSNIPIYIGISLGAFGIGELRDINKNIKEILNEK